MGLQALGDLRVPKNNLSFLLNSIIHITVWSKIEKGTFSEKEHKTKRKRHKT